MTGMAPAQQVYAALSWSAVAFLGVFGMCWLTRPRWGMSKRYWPFVFKIALVGGAVVGLLTLVLGAGFVWEW